MFIRIYMVVFIILFSSQSHAFDGKRKGFVGILGLGIAPVSHWESTGDWNETRLGTYVQVYLGYGFNEKNCIFWGVNGSFYDSKRLPQVNLGQGLHGIHWYHYYDEKNKSFFSTVGAGLFAFSTKGALSNSDRIGSSGYGFNIGFGYQINRLLLGVNYTHGWTEKNSIDYRHNVLGLMISIVGS